MLDNAQARTALSRVIEPIARRLISWHISPDSVTFFGAVLSSLSVLLFIPDGKFWTAAILFGICGLSDLLDGTMARMTGSASKWGAFLDSTLDRIVDASVIVAIALYLHSNQPVNQLALIATFVALVSGQLISYVRARAEALGAKATVGVAERAERSLIIWLALVISGFGMNVISVAMYLLATLSVITVCQRIVHIRKQLVTKQ